MKLRFFQTCDSDGVKSRIVLQWWNTAINTWQDVPLIECPLEAASDNISELGEYFEYAED